MSGMLINIGAVSGLWGIFWFMWDKYSTVPGWLLGIGIVCLVLGSALP